MFNRKECKRCGEKANSKSSFCPSCGNPFGNKQARQEDFGMLGENDLEENYFENFTNSIFGGMGGKMMTKMFESAMKMLEKEMQKEMHQDMHKQHEPKTNFQLFINGKRVDVSPQKTHQKKNEKEEVSLPQKILKKFAELPKKEPKTNVRRFSDKVVYEISLPGVNSDENLSITKLENSIEIKAVTKSKAYQKIIPVNLQVTNYNLSRGKLVLELAGE